jgi:gas vesicle protein
MNMQNNGTTSMIVGLATGLAAGMALGLALAPKEGRETREMVRQAIESGMERVRRRGD